MSNNIGKLNIEIGANGRQAIEELNELINVFQKFSDFNFSPINKASKSISSLCQLDPSNLNYLQESLSSFFISLNNTNINIAGCQDLYTFVTSIKQLGQKGRILET